MPPSPESLWAHLRRNVQMASFAVIVLAVLVGVGFAFFVRGQTLMEAQLRENLRMVAAAASYQFDADILEKIQGPESVETPIFAEVVHRLGLIQKDMPTIRFSYLMRRTEDPNVLAFIADADSLATVEELDENVNGVVDEDEEASYPGDAYDISEVPALQGEAFERPAVDAEITQDQWGSLISGYAPIKNASGETVAVLGIDMVADQFIALSQRLFSPVSFLLFLFGSLLFTFYILFFVWRRRMEVLQRLDEERKGLMLLASHQLGTPLTIFRWSLEALEDSRARKCLGEEAYQEHVVNMQEGIERLRAILDELKNATSVQEGKLMYRPERIYLSELILDVVRTAKPYFEQRNQHLKVDLGDNFKLDLDANLLKAVVRELLDNAAMFSRPDATTTISTRKHKMFAEIEIRDEGCGITHADQRQLFEKFFRGQNAYTYKPDGAGLGLFVAQGIVEKCGGSILIESKEGKGTSVFVRLPMAQ
jgi:signal transduction histidine kinase